MPDAGGFLTTPGGFSPTNTTPLMIQGVGQPVTIAGYAQLAVQNSTLNVPCYLGQYFQQAWQLDPGGNPTTNPAGILSPYGDFFPTQPGLAALVTMPDLDTGAQGTNVVRVIALNADANHDGILDFTFGGPDQTSVSRPFRFWVNDNRDSGDDGGNGGIPGLVYPLADGVNSGSYGADGFPVYEVHGTRDLVDFFPVYVNLGSLFQSNALSAGISPTDPGYQFVLSQADGALRFAFTSLTPTNYMNYLRDTNTAESLANAQLFQITPDGVLLPPSFLAGIATNNQGILLVEAWTNTVQPLVLTVYQGGNLIAQTPLYLSITGVEQMFRHKSLLLNPNISDLPDRLTDGSVPNEPDTNDKNFVFLHGYNVLPNEARGVASDVFKRMYWSGSHAKFWAVTWEGADTKNTYPFYSTCTPNFHTNVVNAFLTAPLLANFVSSLSNSGPVVVAAHSLGNMVTLSAINDWNAPISQYFMLDCAVPIEAIDPTAITNVMIISTWMSYSNRLYASDWYQLFPTNDARSTLTWNNRLGNLQNVAVYNFYSSGEEILREDDADPPTDFYSAVVTQLADAAVEGVPFGTYTWYWQEKGKGPSTEDWLLGSSHGGWKFNTYWLGALGFPQSPAIMNDTPNSILLTFPMFDFNSTVNSSLLDIDNELLGVVYGVDPSVYAAANRNRILSDAIPAMSLVTGANPVPLFSPPRSATQRNFDMMTFENGWPQGRLNSREVNKWHHSDFVNVAYPFTYKLFNQFVTTGNLK